MTDNTTQFFPHQTTQYVRYIGKFCGEFVAPNGESANLHKIGPCAYVAVRVCPHGSGRAVAKSNVIFGAHIKRIGSYRVSAAQRVERYALLSHERSA